MPHEVKTTASTLVVKDAAQGLVSAVFADTTPTVVDHDGDVYGSGAIRAGTVPVSTWNHDSAMSGALPVGKATVRTVGTEAIADLEYFLDLPRGREAFEVMRKLGSVEWSWTLDIKSAEPAHVNGRQVRRILDVAPLEVSPVLQAAGIGTRTLEVRSASNAVAVEIARYARDRHNERQRRELAAIRERVRA